MRILHVMHHSLPGTDGYSIRAKYLLEAQVAFGHDVTVLTSPSQGPDAVDADIAGIRYRRSHYTPAERRWVPQATKHLVFGRSIGRRLERLLDSEAFDIVHAHTPFTVALPAMSQARRRQLPFVYEKRNLWEETAVARGKAVGRWPWYQLARGVDRWVSRRADAVCTITEALKQHTIDAGVATENIFVVGNGVDTQAFTPQAAPPELRAQCAADGDFVIGFVGSFFSFEGLPMLLEAFARLLAKHPRARLVLVGDGEDKARLDARVAELGLQHAVWLVGRVPHDRVLPFCAAMDVLVYPRLRSPLTEMISPLKPLEPMAMGRCVLGSDVGGIRELIRDGDTGLLFEADSQASLEARLELLLSRRVDAAALGERARQHVVAHRQWRHMAQSYEAAYRHASARVPAAAQGRVG